MSDSPAHVPRAGFVGPEAAAERLRRLLARPDTAERVAAIREGMRRADTALAAAIANAALEGIALEPDEVDLILRRQDGELNQAQFLAAAEQLARHRGAPPGGSRSAR